MANPTSSMKPGQSPKATPASSKHLSVRPENLGPELNGPGQEIEPWISPDGKLLVFAAKGRSDSRGDYDLYASHLCSGGWSPPRPLAGGVNSPSWDFAGRFSPDGRSFFFASNRPRWSPPEPPLAGADGYRRLVDRLAAPGNGLFEIKADAAMVIN